MMCVGLGCAASPRCLEAKPAPAGFHSSVLLLNSSSCEARVTAVGPDHEAVFYLGWGDCNLSDCFNKNSKLLESVISVLTFFSFLFSVYCI